MDHIKGKFTVLPFLVAMLVAVAGMPGHVFLVNRGELGIEHGQPWRASTAGVVGRIGRTLMSRLREMCSGWRGQPLALPAACVAVALLCVGTPTDGLLLATVPAVGLTAANQLKALRAQQDTNRRDLLALNQVRADGGTLTEDQRTRLATLKVEAETIAEALQIAHDANEADRTAPDPDVKVGQDRAELEHKAPGFFGRQLMAVRNFAANGGWSHISAEEQRILRVPIGGGRPSPVQAAATGLNTDTGSEGGFLVGQERATTIWQRSYSQGEILKRITRLPLGPQSNGMKLPAIDETSRADNSRFGGIASGWLGQGNTLTSGKPKFREMDMKLRKVGAFVYATEEMLFDALALEGWINKYLPLELTFRSEDAVLNGTGSNQPLGARNSGALISVARATSGRILSDDLRGMWNRMWAPARKNAVWLVDQSTEGEFDQLAVAVGTGGALDPSYKPAGTVPGQEFATYKGRPIIPVEYCANLGSAGDVTLFAPDEYTLIERGGVDAAVSMHVAFLTDEQVFRFMLRLDGQLNWNAPLTPKSGGPTLTAVVGLAA